MFKPSHVVFLLAIVSTPCIGDELTSRRSADAVLAQSREVANALSAAGFFRRDAVTRNASPVIQRVDTRLAEQLDLAASGAPYLGWEFGIASKSGPAAAAANSQGFASAMARMNANGGGRLLLPCGDIYVKEPIDNKYARVEIIGCGGLSAFHDAGTPTYGTRILPTTAFVDAVSGADVGVLRHRTPYSVRNAKNSGGGFTDLVVDANGVGRRLLDVDSVINCTERLVLIDAVGREAVLVHAGVSGKDLAEAADVQGCNFDLQVRQIDGAAAKRANLVTLDGSSNANTSANTFRIRGQFADGIALDAVNADNNTIDLSATRLTGGKGFLAFMHGGRADGSVGGYSNVFTKLGGTAPSYAEGLNDKGVTAGGSNVVLALDGGNGTPQPTAGTGAYWLVYDNQFNNIAGANMSSTVIGDYPKTAFDARTHQLPRSSLTVFNSAQAHLDLTDGTAEWLVRVLSGGGLDVTPLAGAHHVVTVPELSANGRLSGASISINPPSASHRLYDDGDGRLAFEVGTKGKSGYVTFSPTAMNLASSQSLQIGGASVVDGRRNVTGETVTATAGFQGRLMTPTSAHAPCTAGQFADDASFHYVCTERDTWKRAILMPFVLPALTNAGRSPKLSAGADDMHGTVVEGSDATGFTLTFGTSKTHAADCLISSPTATAFKSYRTSPTALVVSNAAVPGATFTYHCRAD